MFSTGFSGLLLLLLAAFELARDRLLVLLVKLFFLFFVVFVFVSLAVIVSSDSILAALFETPAAAAILWNPVATGFCAHEASGSC